MEPEPQRENPRLKERIEKIEKTLTYILQSLKALELESDSLIIPAGEHYGIKFE